MILTVHKVFCHGCRQGIKVSSAIDGKRVELPRGCKSYGEFSNDIEEANRVGFQYLRDAGAYPKDDIEYVWGDDRNYSTGGKLITA